MKPVREYSTLFFCFFCWINRKVTSTVKRTHRYTASVCQLICSPSCNLYTHQPVIDICGESTQKATSRIRRDQVQFDCFARHNVRNSAPKSITRNIEARQCAHQDEGRGFERSPRICDRHFRRAPIPFQMAIIGRFHVFLPGLRPG